MFLLVFRTFRVFRIFKLFKNGDLRMLAESIIFTMSTVGPYPLFLTFFIYIFALIGMSFFAGKFRFDAENNINLVNGTPPRENFDTLGSTLISIMNMMFGTWHVIMMNAMRTTSWAASIYFVCVYIMSAIILLNLFLAIMLRNFEMAKVYGQKKKLFEAFDELINR